MKNRPPTEWWPSGLQKETRETERGLWRRVWANWGGGKANLCGESAGGVQAQAEETSWFTCHPKQEEGQLWQLGDCCGIRDVSRAQEELKKTGERSGKSGKEREKVSLSGEKKKG